MGGLEATEIKLSEVHAENLSFRFDPEFFNKVALRAVHALKGNPRLSSLVESGYRVVYENTHAIERSIGIDLNLPFFLQATDIVTPFIEPDEMNCVAESDWNRYVQGRIIPGEVLIEVKGRAGKVAIVPDDFPRKTLVSGTCYKLSVRDPLDKHLLATFLTCRYGQALKDRLKTNLLVSFIAKDDLYSLPIPKASDNFKREISRLFVAAERHQKQSKNRYTQAETLLLRELGLEGWQPPEPLAYQSTYSQAWGDGRLDAEHFQPKYDALRKHLMSKGAFRLGDRLSEPIRRGVSPEYVEEGGDVVVINSQHVGKLQVETEQTRKTSQSLLKEGQDKGQVRRGDVLLNSTGYITIGRCQCLLEDVTAVVDNHVAIIRPQPPIDPVYLACFLNARAGQMQTESGWTGSSGQIELRPDVIADYLVWDAPPETQAEVRQKIEEAHRARGQAKQLLETAKRAVEVAIEDGESAALALLADERGRVTRKQAETA